MSFIGRAGVGAVAGVGLCCILATPARAAEWMVEAAVYAPYQLSERSDTAGGTVPRAAVADVGLPGSAAGTVVTGADLTVTAPDGVAFFEYQTPVMPAGHTYPDIRRSTDSRGNFDLCSVVSPSVVRCVFAGAGTSSSFATGDGSELVMNIPFSVSPDATGVKELTVEGSVTTADGTAAVPPQVAVTVDAGPPVDAPVVDAPVISGAAGGVAVLVAAGMGGLATLRQRRWRYAGNAFIAASSGGDPRHVSGPGSV